MTDRWRNFYSWGGFVGSALFGWDVTGFSIVLAFLGAVLFPLVLRMIPGRQPFER